MESFMQLMTQRFSVRSYTEEPVRQADLDKILEAGRLAPTGHNNQPQRIIVLRGEEGIEKLQKITRCHFGAKTALLVCRDTRVDWERKYDGYRCGETDCAIVTAHMQLEAWDIGVASCWVHFFKAAVAREELGLPDYIQPLNLLVLGYAAADAAPIDMHFDKKPLSEIVCENQWTLDLPSAEGEDK